MGGESKERRQLKEIWGKKDKEEQKPKQEGKLI